MNKNMTIIFIVGSILIISLCTYACTHKKTLQPLSQVVNAEWVKDATIYELNVRQYSPEGTLKSVTDDLSRLKEMGIDIIWLMPIFPISKTNMKATQLQLVEEIENPKEREKYLGSYYASSDYMAVNPEFGTMDDLKLMVQKSHELGMYVILDIAVNHTGWDHKWIVEHPEFYTKVDSGKTPWKKQWMKEHPEYYTNLKKTGMTYPIDPDETDWWDTADLNYESDELREKLKEVFKFWITEADIDGYRCDVASRVPTDFWEDLRPELDAIKPVFMLAEADMPEHHVKAFDASYDWKLHHLLNKISKGDTTARSIWKHVAMVDTTYPQNSILMQFITNHDENSWNGTIAERLGASAETFAIVYYTLPGMPLIYSGQEAGMDKRLRFFEKDTIGWGCYRLSDLYKNLNILKKENPALYAGKDAGKLTRIKNSMEKSVLSFARESENNKVIVIANLSKDTLTVDVKFNELVGEYTDYFKKESKTFQAKESLKLGAWGYLVFTSKEF